MFKKILFFLVIIAAIIETDCMMLAPQQLFYKTNCATKTEQFFLLHIEKQLHDNAQKVITELGKLPLPLVHEKVITNQFTSKDLQCFSEKQSSPSSSNAPPPTFTYRS